MSDVGIDGFAGAEIIGRGAFGSVYRATQADLERLVALKVFQGAPDDQSLNDFLRECRALGALDWCRNIVTVFGTGRTRHGEPYLAMEYCPGGSLAALGGRESTMSEAQVRHIAIEVATALQVAHDAGILHRDVKPANILLSRSGVPVLADFGIARLANANTRSVGISGTIAFSAPEILNGESPTQRADIYSYGATLYSLLTGRSPHALTEQDTTQTMIVRALSGQTADLTALPISSEFRAVLARCLEHEPAKRYADMHEVLHDLADLETCHGVGLADTRATVPSPHVWPEAFYLPSSRGRNTSHRSGSGETWPSATEYVAAIQQLSSPLPPDAGLRDVRLATDVMGLPASASGQNAVVFEILHAEGSAAARYFTRHHAQARLHYQAVSDHLRSHPMSVVSPARWFDDGIEVRGQQRPLVLMPWIPGSPLNLAIEDRLADKEALLSLASTWLQVVESMAEAGVAHGDLQCGNVLVDDEGSVRLVDLDGFYVPGMSTAPDEMGHPHFQHPARSTKDWGPEMDGTSAAIVALSVRALAFDPELWSFHTGENLILSQSDLNSPNASPVWQRLRVSPDETVRLWGDRLAAWCAQSSPPKTSDVLNLLTGREGLSESPVRTIVRSELPLTPSPPIVPADSSTDEPAPWWDDADVARQQVSVTASPSAADEEFPWTVAAAAKTSTSNLRDSRPSAPVARKTSQAGLRSQRLRLNSVAVGAMGGYFGALFALLFHLAFLKGSTSIDADVSLLLFVIAICALVAAGPRAFTSLLLRDFKGAIKSGLIRGLLGVVMGLVGLACFQVLVDTSTYKTGVRAAPWIVVLAWCLVGTGVGLAVGVVRRDGRAFAAGVLGGLAGGAMGGLIHAALGDVRFVGDGMVAVLNLTTAESRTWIAVLVGGTVVGAAIGLASQITKRFWLTILEGPQRGLEVILDGKEATIGSSMSDTVRLPASQAKGNHVFLKRSDKGEIAVTFRFEGGLNGENCKAGTTHSATSGDILRVGGDFIRLDQRP